MDIRFKHIFSAIAAAVCAFSGMGTPLCVYADPPAAENLVTTAPRSAEDEFRALSESAAMMAKEPEEAPAETVSAAVSEEAAVTEVSAPAAEEKQTELFITGTALTGTVPDVSASSRTDTEEDSGSGAKPSEEEKGIEFDDTAHGFMAELYNSRNGLPGSEANAVTQTPDGFIWIGSYAGLTRFDGKNFYRIDHSAGVTGVSSLYTDSLGRLWIGTNDKGIVMYKDGVFKTYDKANGLRSLSVYSAAEDDNGNVLFATAHGIAYIDKYDELNIIDDPIINDEYVTELRSEGETVYGVTVDGAFFSIDGLKITSYYSSDSTEYTISSVMPDIENVGYVYLGTTGSDVLHVNMANGLREPEIISVSPLGRINMMETVNDVIWVCTDMGIGCIKDGSFTVLPNLPMRNSVDSCFRDREGNLWFASARQGVMKMVRSRFVDIDRISGMGSPVVNTTCVSGDSVFVGTDSGLYVIDREKMQLREHELCDLLSGVRIRSIKRDSHGGLWLCTYSDMGLLRYTPDGGIFSFNREGIIPSKKVRTVCELQNGNMAVAVSDGVYVIDPDTNEAVSTYTSANGLGNTQVLSLSEDELGRLLIGTDGDGMYIIDGDNTVRMGLEDGLQSEIILRIKYDMDKRLHWIVTSNSLAVMRDGKIRTVTNFPYANNFDLFSDGNGRTWVLSSAGIFVVSTDDLINNTKGMSYRLFNGAAGLPCVSTVNSRSDVDENGFLFISGSEGVTGVNINEPIEETSGAILAIASVEIDGREQLFREGEIITIPEDATRITINAFPITFGLTDPTVTYYLFGFEEKDTVVKRSELTPISYTNLKGGSYYFTMSLIGPNGNHTQTITLKIVKEVPIYQQTWFGIIMFLAAIGILLALTGYFYQRRSKEDAQKLKEKNEILNQTITAFAKCIDMKDNYTKGHSFRVAKYTRAIAAKMGRFSQEELDTFYNVGLLHDIGKISIPDAILNKPGKLTDEEYEIMKSHAWNGYEVLKEIKAQPVLAYGAGYHHERINGTGYPHAYTADRIPEVAQIIAVADTFDAMYSTRVYRRKLELETVADEIYRCRGSYYNEEVVAAFMKLVEEGAFDYIEDGEDKN